MAAQSPESAPRIDTPLPTYANMTMVQESVPQLQGKPDPKAGTRRMI